MCQAKIFIKVGDEEREYCKDIDEMELKEDKIILKSLFEEPKIVKGKIKYINFLKAKVVIESDEFPK
ncbi:CooT family nickel-binding protein [Thermodesulfobacterium hydrogeniphilum]|uniref:CooT family nickel-binding protein n=1 Tax=Thermodesulfobacterium hydrogeniphilum TaxID=161156 RepID=UPI0005704AF5|nr:CooT family nickel-binding protein [Thermodesulfobacterium hydrogeniphilum]